jgi:hydrogenase maturation protease
MTSRSQDQPRLLIAGVGNIFLGDDAFGVEVVQRLARRPLPDGVRVVDFGIRGLDLGFALLEGYTTVVLVDAAPRGGEPGTLYVLEPDLGQFHTSPEAKPLLETHNMDLTQVLRLAEALGGPMPQLVLVGCEPEPFPEDEDFPAGMSGAVQAAVDEAVVMIESLLGQLLPAEGEAGTTTAERGEQNTISAQESQSCQR